MTHEYPPIKCEFCKSYMPRQIEYNDGDTIGFRTKCTPCIQNDELMDRLLNYRI